MPELSRSVTRILTELIKIRKTETLGILADNAHYQLAGAFYQAARKQCRNVLVTIVKKVPSDRESLLASLSPCLQQCHALVMLTDKSFSHLPARRKLSRSGLRIASFPGVTEACLKRTVSGDLLKPAEFTRKLADILTIASSGTLTTSSGTDISFTLKTRKGHADTGFILNPGDFTNLPAGEASFAPDASSAEGVLVLDGSFPHLGIMKKPVTVTVKQGRAVRICGDEEAVAIRKMWAKYGKNSRLIAEIGIGTNPKAKFTGLTLEDEKVFGSMHIAFGNNVSFGGNNAVGCHYDAVILNPTLVLDGKVILKHGIFHV